MRWLMIGGVLASLGCVGAEECLSASDCDEEFHCSRGQCVRAGSNRGAGTGMLTGGSEGSGAVDGDGEQGEPIHLPEGPLEVSDAFVSSSLPRIAGEGTVLNAAGVMLPDRLHAWIQVRWGGRPVSLFIEMASALVEGPAGVERAAPGHSATTHACPDDSGAYFSYDSPPDAVTVVGSWEGPGVPRFTLQTSFPDGELTVAFTAIPGASAGFHTAGPEEQAEEEPATEPPPEDGSETPVPLR